MAVYIKKENLGSRPKPARQPTGILGKIQNMKTFQQLQESYAQSKIEAKEAMKDKYESNAEVQRWRNQMTPEQRTREAIDRMIPTARTVAEMRNGGKEVSYEEARKLAENIAYKSEAKKKEGDE